MQKFWDGHTGLITDDPGLSFGGIADTGTLACKWNHIVGDASVADFFTVSSLEEQQEVFHSWPIDKLKKQFGYGFI